MSPTTLKPLPFGAVRPTGSLANQLRALWESGEVSADERPELWLPLALFAGGGRGRIEVRRWLDRSFGPSPLSAEARLEAILDRVAPLSGPAAQLIQTAEPRWADLLEPLLWQPDPPWADLVRCAALVDPLGLRICLYAPWDLKGTVAGTEVRVEVETTLPAEPRVKLRVHADRLVEFTLFFRMPDWAQGCLVSGQGTSAGEVEEETGWISLRRTWGPGDEVELQFETDSTPSF